VHTKSAHALHNLADNRYTRYLGQTVFQWPRTPPELERARTIWRPRLIAVWARNVHILKTTVNSAGFAGRRASGGCRFSTTMRQGWIDTSYCP